MGTDSSAAPTTAASRVGDLPPNIRLGSLGRRFVGWLIDGLPLPILAIAPGILLLNDGPTDVLIVVLGAVAVLALGWLWVSWWMLAHRLGTPGMRVMRLQALQGRSGRPLGWGRALLRQLVFAALASSVIGWLVSIIMLASSPKRQGLHDLAAGSVVIDERTEAETEPATLLPLDPRSAKGRPAAPDEAAPDEATPDEAAPDEAAPDEAAPDEAARAAESGAAVGGLGADGRLAPGVPVAERTTNDNSDPLETAETDDSTKQSQDAEPPVNPFARPVPSASASTTVMAAIPAEAESDVPSTPPAMALADSELAAPPVDRPRSSARWMVDLGGGRIVPLRRVLLIGRNPQAALGEDADVVGVGVHAATVSKTHLAVGWDDEGPWVMDRGSTNGTAVAADEGALERCAPNEKVRVRQGQIVSYGGQQLRIHRS